MLSIQRRLSERVTDKAVKNPVSEAQLMDAMRPFA
jgi:hypothetical protein